jgi:methionine-rich copper-binding protein CopC
MNTKHLIATLAFLTIGAASAGAQAHAKIETSQPKANSELTSAPAEIRLQFNEALEPAFSKIELLDATQAAIALPKIALDKADSKVMFAPVPTLQPGRYEVRWSTMTHDGHKAKGRFAFSVK